MRLVGVVFFCTAIVSSAFAQSAVNGAANRKQATAARVPNGSIHVDGRIDEEVWQKASPITDFIQKEPVEGAKPTDPMEVRLAYDDDGLYVGARMFSTDGRIQAPLGRRDSVDQAEHILVSFDTFLDRRTAFVFGVTASGVRIDRYHSSDNEDSFDSGFDPVWRAETSVGGDQWTAELWIPFSQLRFTPGSNQTWGLNLSRFRPTLDEEDFWIVIPRTVRAWSSRFGDLAGLNGIVPPRRIEALPYVAGGSTVSGGDRDRNNPFDDGKNLAGRVGADVKMGLGPNLTLETTINPDFGQVEADPAEVNLTAFETRFSEKRPFFLEGAQLFNIGHPNFYYSRRIGRTPIGPATGDYVDYPSSNTILAAAKLTGRLPSKTSIGLITAVTDSEEARVATLNTVGAAASSIRGVGVSPRAFHTVGRVLQEFGPSASTAGLIFDAVHRDFEDGSPLADLYTRNALALAGNALLRFKGGRYEFRASGGQSFINGAAGAITRVQRSSAHYAQRPDRDYAPLDPTRTSLTGWSYQFNFDKTGGKHWLWGGNTKIDSENFETNDFAQLNGADGLLSNANIRYRETQPGTVFRSYYVQLDGQTDTTLRGLMQAGHVRGTFNMTWVNFWTSQIQVSRELATNSVSLTRGGPLMARGAGWSTNISVGNRASSRTRITGSTFFEKNEDGGSVKRVTGLFSMRPGPRWQFTVSPFYDRVTEPQQYISTLGGGRAATYNNRYVFAFIDRSTMSMEYRLGLTLKPDVNLDVYAEPFAASGRYYDYGELLAPGSRERLKYGTSGTTLTINPDGSGVVTDGASTINLRNRDFNTLSFRSNVVLRWEWRTGSTLYVVWQQDRAGTEVLGTRVNVGDAFRSLTAPGPNIFLVKTSFWIPVK
ncbi:MAG TPA: DUF5916 domain-containing protein [Vicinamibacterales bacterium]|nr:DUF5916 domain-containing protein [Vicinamibacterales bacterium]